MGAISIKAVFCPADYGSWQKKMAPHTVLIRIVKFEVQGCIKLLFGRGRRRDGVGFAVFELFLFAFVPVGYRAEVAAYPAVYFGFLSAFGHDDTILMINKF
jgi:hypothetical protein